MSKEGAEVTSAGRAFQTRAPATEKARRPTVGSLTAGTHRSSEVEDRRDRSLCRVGMSGRKLRVDGSSAAGTLNLDNTGQQYYATE